MIICEFPFVCPGTNHEHDQPSHLKLKDPTTPEWHNGPQYAAMESR